VHAPTDPFPMGALAPTAPGKSVPMQSTNVTDRHTDGQTDRQTDDMRSQYRALH